MQPVVKNDFADGVNVEERRPRVIEAETGIVSVEFVQVLGALDLKRVHRKVPVFVPRLNKEKFAIGQREDNDDTQKNEQSGSGEEAFQARGKKEEVELRGIVRRVRKKKEAKSARLSGAVSSV